jgi:PAS domain S-box-containing protein
METQVLNVLLGSGWLIALVAGFLFIQRTANSKEWQQDNDRLRKENERLAREKREIESESVASGHNASGNYVTNTQELLEVRSELEAAAARARVAEDRVSDAIARAELAATQLQELEQQAKRLESSNMELQQKCITLEAKLIEMEENSTATVFPVSGVVQTVPIPDPETIQALEATRAELAQVQEQLAQVNQELEVARATESTTNATGELSPDLEALRAERDNALAEIEVLRVAEQEQEDRIQRLQQFAEEKVGKLLAENRDLKSRMETLGTAANLSMDGAGERLLSLATMAPFGVFEADAEGNWSFANSGWSKIAGVASAKAVADGWKECIAEADRNSVESAWGMMVTTGNPFSRTFRLVTPEGQTRWVAMRAGQVVVGEKKSFIGFVEDITERRRAEESSRSTSICLRSVVDASMEAIVFLNRRGDVTSWNGSAERMFGYSQEEALGRSLMALLVPDDQASLRHALSRSAQSDQLHSSQLIEGLALCKTGSTMPVEISVAAWRAGEFGEEDADIRYTATIRDITERRRAEDMRRDKEAAEEANRAKSQFLANMSHELRTPLNAIIGFSEILHDRTFGDLTQKQERYVGNILSSGRHLLQLINDILDLSKVEAGHMKVEYAAFPVAVAIRNVEGLVKVLLQKKNLVLETEIPEELPVLIADQAKFKQILYNLTSNAIKFTPEGGRITIAASAVNDGKMLEVSVTDTGIGIKQEDQDRIFREFEQVDNSYARMQQGTGLGLALVKRFVEVHGGRVRVYSGGEGKGTTFTFMMPFTPPDEDEVEAEVFEVASVATPELGKPIILVVDDDQSASELLTHHLQGAGYAVSRAFSATDALVLAREMQPHVITLDVQLPDKEGWEVLAELKRDPVTRNIPVLMVSILEDRDRALQLGAADCFVKPVVKDRLLGAIAREVTANSQRRNIVGTPVMAESVVAVASNGTANGNGTHEESDTVEEASEESAESTPTRGRRGSRTRTAG